MKETLSEFDPHDPVWKILGKAKPAEASQFFAGKVLRAIEAEPELTPRWLPAWLFHSVAPIAACATVALLALAGLRQASDSPAGQFGADRVVDFETIADLDLLAANSDASLWLTDSSSVRP